LTGDHIKSNSNNTQTLGILFSRLP